MTHWTDHYLGAEYEDGARGPDRYDCWGLVRDVRHRIFGKPLMASWGYVTNDNLTEFTHAYERERGGFEQCDPEPGAIATAFRGVLVYHVAIVCEVDRRLYALEIRNRKGVTLTPIADFIARCRHVEFYRDR